MTRKLLGLLCFTILSQRGFSQDTLHVSLADVLAATARDNKELLLASLDQKSAAARFNQTNAVLLPQINLSYTALTTNNPLNAFGFKLQQQSVAPSDFNPELLNNPSASQNYFAKAEWNQPVLNLDRMYQRKAVEQQVDVFHFKAQRTKEYLLFAAQKAYTQLQLSHEAVSVLADALQTVNAIFRSSQNYFEKGYMQKSDLLLVQVQVASVESKLAMAKSNVRNASDYLSLLMGRSGGPVYAVDSLQQDGDKPTAMQVPDNRADFSALKSAMKGQEMMVRAEQMSLLPKINAFAHYMINDKAALGFGSNSYFIGAQLSWSLFSGTASHFKAIEQNAELSRLQQQLSYQRDQAQVELGKAKRQLEDARFALQQFETSVSQATEALRIRQDRFQEGIVSVNDLLQAQSALSEQKLLRSEAVFQYNTAIAYLQFLTSTKENN